MNETFVMCPPEFLSTRIPNNVFMKGAKIDKARAMAQYKRITHLIRSLGVTVLEIPPVEKGQDQVYTANIAVSIEPFIVLANFKAPGRDVEEKPAREFFEKRGYRVIQPPHDFEGEADLKLWKNNTYFGGFGKFTDIKAHEWIHQRTGAHIIPVKETSDQLYHLDCSLFVIDDEHVMVNRKGLDPKAFKEIEKVAEVIVVPEQVFSTGCTNCVKVPDKQIILSGLFFPEEYKYQKAMDWLNKTFDPFGYTCCFMDIDEFDKSGADISCCVMHLTFEPEKGHRNEHSKTGRHEMVTEHEGSGFRPARYSPPV